MHQREFDSGSQIFVLSKRFPTEERYSLTDQVRRSSRSVCANIVEAWRKRRYPASFASKLGDADAEAAETQVWLATALDRGDIAADEHAKLTDRYDHVCAQLVRMMSAPERWCGSPEQRGTEP